jgi:hypothetical protein
MTEQIHHSDNIDHFHIDGSQYHGHHLHDFHLTINGLKIDPVIFVHGFVNGCDLGICKAECCGYGVYVDIKDQALFLSLKEQIVEVMDDSQIKDWTAWFDPEQEDTDFPSGMCVGTKVHNNKCVFQDRHGYCSLQVLAMKHQKTPWAYKPYYCVLYPLTVLNRILTFDDRHAARLHYCNMQENCTQTIFEVCTSELIYTLGDEGYRELAA